MKKILSGLRFSLKNIWVEGGSRLLMVVFEHVQLCGQLCVKGSQFSTKVLNGLQGLRAGFPFGLINGWTRVLLEGWFLDLLTEEMTLCFLVMLLTSLDATGMLSQFLLLGSWCLRLKRCPFLFRPLVHIIFLGLPPLMVHLSWKKLIGWSIVWMTQFLNPLVRENGYGRFSLFLKSGASNGNVGIVASLLGMFSRREVCLFQPYARFAKMTNAIIHILRDCSMARQTWNALSIPLDSNMFFNLNLVDWLRTNCLSSKNHERSSISWGVIFPVGIWTLWLFRNRVVFRNDTSSRRLSSEILSRASEMAFIVLNGNSSTPRTTIQIR